MRNPQPDKEFALLPERANSKIYIAVKAKHRGISEGDVVVRISLTPFIQIFLNIILFHENICIFIRPSGWSVYGRVSVGNIRNIVTANYPFLQNYFMNQTRIFLGAIGMLTICRRMLYKIRFTLLRNLQYGIVFNTSNFVMCL